MSTYVATEEELARARAILQMVDHPGPGSTRETVLLGALSGAEMLGFLKGQREKVLKLTYNPAEPCGILSLARVLVFAGYAAAHDETCYQPEMQKLMYGYERWILHVVRFAEQAAWKEARDRIWKLILGK